MKTIDYRPVNSHYRGVIVAKQIVHLTKSDDGEKTLIHLKTGEILESEDSLNTLQARIHSIEE